MKVYAVRCIETHEPVGVFYANHDPKQLKDGDLSDRVDTVTSPDQCEFKIVDFPCTLFAWPDHETWKMGSAEVPKPSGDDAEERIYRHLAIGYESPFFQSFFMGEEEITGWTPLARPS